MGEDKTRKSQRDKAHYAKMREEALTVLGGACVHCGFDDERALHIDHVDGGGNLEQREKGWRVRYAEVISELYPGKYQVLCANHNAIKRYTHDEMNPRKRVEREAQRVFNDNK